VNKKLSWSKSPPKVEGFYWLCRDGEAFIVHVGVSVPPTKKGDEWYGPLPVPAGP
jgi:hypothetical protein